MYCTSKERETCEVEKRGCVGCFYNDIAIENEIAFIENEDLRNSKLEIAIKNMIAAYRASTERIKELEKVLDNSVSKERIQIKISECKKDIEWEKEYGNVANREKLEKKIEILEEVLEG